jgi:hypothetical protein
LFVMGKFFVGSALALVLTTSSWSQEVDPVIVVAAHKIEVPCQSALPVHAAKQPRRRVHYHHRVARPHPLKTKVAYKHKVKHKHVMRPRPVCYAETAPFNPEYLALLADAPPVAPAAAPPIADFAPINVGGTPQVSPNEEFFPSGPGGSTAPFGAIPASSGGPGGGRSRPPGSPGGSSPPPSDGTPPPSDGTPPPGGGTPPPPPVSGVPEPATWAMSILGFYALGAAMRRNRRRAPANA